MGWLLMILMIDWPLGLYEDIDDARPTPPRIQIIWQEYLVEKLGNS
jgi:hypothetical protein